MQRATGVLQVDADVHYEDALPLLRVLAFTRGQELGAVARDVVDGTLSLGQGG